MFSSSSFSGGWNGYCFIDIHLKSIAVAISTHPIDEELCLGLGLKSEFAFTPEIKIFHFIYRIYREVSLPA